MFIPSLMLQGTGSDVGKSVLTAGLCRAYTRRGLKVRPFKPQNMSNNAAVTINGGEIGRAQALQARACGVAPHTDMNPVLLKPQSDTGAQVIVNGKLVGNAKAQEFQDMKANLMGVVLEGFNRLFAGADLVLVEGAGSAAEVNLRNGDIANMGFAEAADLQVILIGDIDRGGVIAQLLGTWNLLTRTERARTRGFIVNKFRGDISLFEEGLTIIQEKSNMFSYGVVPWFSEVSRLPREDAFNISVEKPLEGTIKIAVPILSRIANFDDLDPLRGERDVSIMMVCPGEPLPGDADLVILPGSKATLYDLAFFRAQGWDIDLTAHIRRGGMVLGICGGYQMLGKSISDPDGIEGAPAIAEGLGFLDIETVLRGEKTLVEVSGTDTTTNSEVSGYEMHVGQTIGADTGRPMLLLGREKDGAISADGKIAGCYVHGLFGSDSFRTAFLRRIRPGMRDTLNYEGAIDGVLDALAEHLETNLDLDGMIDD